MTDHSPLEGVDNFRDFGGYRTLGGRRMRRGRLYRSASHGRATDADLERLSALGLAVIVDLRRKGERARDPSRRHAGFAGEVILNDLGDEEEDGWRAHIRRSDLSKASFRDYLLRYYETAPLEPRHLDLFTRYFQVLARVDGPVLIHCAAGKDRTGLLAALTHHVAGVHPDDILDDYLLTNDEARMALRAPAVARAIGELAGRTPSPEAVRVAMGVEAQFLETAFATIRRDFRDLDAYLHQALGVDPAMRRGLEARLLV